MFETIKRNLHSRPQRLFYIWYLLMGILVSTISYLLYIKQIKSTNMVKMLILTSTDLIPIEKIKIAHKN